MQPQRSDDRHTRGHGSETRARLTAFSDALFAFAITLMALELKIPDIVPPVTPSKLASAVLAEWRTIVAFVLSFVIVLTMWAHHRLLMNLVKRQDGAIIFANGFLLMMVSLAPWPMSLVARYATSPGVSTAALAYSVYFLLVNVGYIILGQVVARDQALLETPEDRMQLARFVRIYKGAFVAYLAALLVCLKAPYLGLGIELLLWLYWMQLAVRE